MSKCVNVAVTRLQGWLQGYGAQRMAIDGIVPGCQDAERRRDTERLAKNKVCRVEGGRGIDMCEVTFPEAGEGRSTGRGCRKSDVLTNQVTMKGLGRG
jgi:hypothetical protein